MATAAFDAYAQNYDAALNQGLSISGEGKDFFAAGRVRWLARRLKQLQRVPSSILDFGCGTGSAAEHLVSELQPHALTGIDISPESLEVARRTHHAAGVQFMLASDYRPRAEIDLVFTNGVFHHIPPKDRHASIELIRNALKPGGLFAFWENNPWNPGTRYVMSRVPFDRDAIMVWPHAFRKQLRQSGFDVISTDYQFIFPRFLAPLRVVEPALARFPFGAQYLILAKKK